MWYIFQKNSLFKMPFFVNINLSLLELMVMAYKG